MFFECVVNYWADNEESMYPPVIQYRRHLFTKGESYTEAEANATEWGNKITEEDFSISPIKEIGVYGYLPLSEPTSCVTFFYKVDLIYTETNNRGKDKQKKISLMVRQVNDTEASNTGRDFAREQLGISDAVVKSVSLTEIEDFLEHKD